MDIEIIEQIKKNYPELYNISKQLHNFDEKVSNMFIEKYGNNTYDNIMKTHEYNKEIENVHNGILKTSSISKLAQKRQKIFQIYTDVTFQITKKIGYSKTIEYMDVLTKYFKTISSII